MCTLVPLHTVYALVLLVHIIVLLILISSHRHQCHERVRARGAETPRARGACPRTAGRERAPPAEVQVGSSHNHYLLVCSRIVQSGCFTVAVAAIRVHLTNDACAMSRDYRTKAANVELASQQDRQKLADEMQAMRSCLQLMLQDLDNSESVRVLSFFFSLAHSHTHTYTHTHTHTIHTRTWTQLVINYCLALSCHIYSIL